jgi:hypothetical protein
MGRHRVAQAPPAPVVSAGIAFAVAVAYLLIIHRQDHGFASRVVFIATFLIAIALALVAGARVGSPLQRAALLSGGAMSLITLGFLGLFSIGLPLMIAGIVAMPPATRALQEAPRPWGPAIVALSSLGAVAVIFAGLLGTR